MANLGLLQYKPIIDFLTTVGQRKLFILFLLLSSVPFKTDTFQAAVVKVIWCISFSDVYLKLCLVLE